MTLDELLDQAVEKKQEIDLAKVEEVKSRALEVFGEAFLSAVEVNYKPSSLTMKADPVSLTFYLNKDGSFERSTSDWEYGGAYHDCRIIVTAEESSRINFFLTLKSLRENYEQNKKNAEFLRELEKYKSPYYWNSKPIEEKTSKLNFWQRISEHFNL